MTVPLLPSNFIKVTSDGQECRGEHNAGWMWQYFHPGGEWHQVGARIWVIQ